ncbi:MAG: hypothetical protein CMD92_08170 [Gammaproteobacteria bacterium]|nr:hypothetical protein [Gammaproteobacteria bacterium]
MLGILAILGEPAKLSALTPVLSLAARLDPLVRAAMVNECVHKRVHGGGAPSCAPMQVEKSALHKREPVPRVREIMAQHHVERAEGSKKDAIDEGHASSVAKHAGVTASTRCTRPLFKRLACNLRGHVFGKCPPEHAWIHVRADFTNAEALRAR